MPEVFLDSEQVCFEGPVPATFSDLIAVIEPSVAASGRVLVGVDVDGRTGVDDLDTQSYVGARRIAFRTLSIAEAVEQLAASCIQRATELCDRLAGLSAEVLREPWPAIAPRLAEAGEPLATLLRDLGSLGGTSPYPDFAHTLEAALGVWLDAVMARDAAGVCLALEKNLLPSLRRMCGRGAGA